MKPNQFICVVEDYSDSGKENEHPTKKSPKDERSEKVH
jgi:hypothetical protein